MLRMQFLNVWVEVVDGEGAEKQQSKHGAPKASYPGGKGTARVCGRDIMGYQSLACLHTGTRVSLSMFFPRKLTRKGAQGFATWTPVL